MAKLKGVITSSANYSSSMSGRRAGVKQKASPRNAIMEDMNPADKLLSGLRDSVYRDKNSDALPRAA